MLEAMKPIEILIEPLEEHESDRPQGSLPEAMQEESQLSIDRVLVETLPERMPEISDDHVSILNETEPSIQEDNQFEPILSSQAQSSTNLEPGRDPQNHVKIEIGENGQKYFVNLAKFVIPARIIKYFRPFSDYSWFQKGRDT